MMLFGGTAKPAAGRLSAGQRAEDFALAQLRAQGLALVERNYRCRGGEIDLVMMDGPQLVFVEVRFRSGQAFGGALESVGARKQARLIHAAAHYLAAKRIDRPTRFDVAAVSPDRDGLAIQWIKSAFLAE